MFAIVSADYNAWANEVLVAYLRGIGRPPKVDAVLAHLAVAGETWLSRLDGAVLHVELWPSLPFEEAAARLADVDGRLREPRGPDARVHYQNSTGAAFENSVAEIMAQALNHATYHRGEIAGLLLAADVEPPYTDYIVYLRQNESRRDS